MIKMEASIGAGHADLTLPAGRTSLHRKATVIHVAIACTNTLL